VTLARSFMKTNVPVAMMMMETNNNVWGETRNPIHTGLSPGGSSGGEGALIAMRGSPLGVGTDIGSSIRIPSAWSQLYGLKPSFGRFPSWEVSREYQVRNSCLQSMDRCRDHWRA
jgi:amidase